MRRLVWLAALICVGGCGTPATVPPVGMIDLTMGACGDDSQCGGATPRCELNQRQCVPCLPFNDNCPKGQRCVASNGTFSCSASCIVDSDCPRSDAGQSATCCSGHCFDTSSDISNCGKCGATCLAPANATAGCASGMCAIGTCNLGFLDCDRGANNGCEVNANSDVKNCGACGKACTAGANESAACVNGACVVTCNGGFGDCDMNPVNGCEVSTTTDGKNCGACGNACALANASSVCKAGACAVDTCQVGFDDCNGVTKDGCESNLQQNPVHCGNCMNACMAANGVPACRNGGCGIASCNMGFADCDSLVINGCEVSTLADPKNCGACARVCSGANSVQVCQVGACQIMSCSPGFSDCDKMPGTGCEINVGGDPMNCGGCGNACPVPANATAACANAQCGVGQCKFGFSDCNKSANDGCEVDLQTVQNCGACGIACMAPPNASAGCKGGMCGVGMCNALFGDCDGNPANGCEKSLATDPAHCGKCGVACSLANAQSQCLGGQCGILQCNQGFANCDGNGANGCEADTRADAKNCGACGVVCPQNTPYCSGGVCSNLLKSCLEYAKGGGQQSGVFTVDPDAGGPIVPFKVYCEMTMDGGGWTLALSKAVDISNPGIPGHSLTWDCMTSSVPPQSPTDDIKTVLNYNNVAAIAPTDMMLMAGRRIIKLMYARPGGVPLVNNYRFLTERTCYDPMGIGDAPTTGGSRFLCGHTSDGCVTTDYALWKQHDQNLGCIHDATNSHSDGAYCSPPNNCGSWGNCPGMSQTPPAPAPNCWFYGGSNACSVPQITACPNQSQAPWGDYTTGTLSGYYNLWIR